MIAAKCKKCGNIGCNGNNIFCSYKEEISLFIQTEIEDYLKDKFTPCDCYTYKSKNKWIGAGTGDDSTLYLYTDNSQTMIWWKENRGFEKTIFEGRNLKSIDELDKILDLLDIKTYLKW